MICLLKSSALLDDPCPITYLITRSAEGYLYTVEIAHEQQAQVKIEVVEIDSVLKRCALDIFVGSVAQVGIRLFKREQIKAKAIIAYVK